MYEINVCANPQEFHCLIIFLYLVLLAVSKNMFGSYRESRCKCLSAPLKSVGLSLIKKIERRGMGFYCSYRSNALRPGESTELLLQEQPPAKTRPTLLQRKFRKVEQCM